MSALRKKLKKIVPPFLAIWLYKIINLKNIFLYPKFFADYSRFKKMTRLSAPRFPMGFGSLNPRLGEATATMGFDHHYVYHPAWAARVLSVTKPDFHTDISSSVYFVAVASAFTPIKYYDYRSPELELPGITCGQADLLALPFNDNELKSLSCMHVVEHVGLGRYGDKLDPDGDIKAMGELKRVLAPGGNLLFVVPMGRPRLQFNAHRVYSYEQIVGQFAGLELREFALIRDGAHGGGLKYGASQADADEQEYGCGCFWFKKPII